MPRYLLMMPKTARHDWADSCSDKPLNQSIAENARAAAEIAAAPEFKSIEVSKVQDNLITPIV